MRHYLEAIIGITREVWLGCLLMAMCAGCGGNAEPVTGEEVSPIQLRNTQEQAQAVEADLPAAGAIVGRSSRKQVSPAAPVLARSKSPDEVLQMTAMDLPKPRAQQVNLEQDAEIPPGIEPLKPGGPMPLVSEVEMPLLKEPGKADELVSVNFDGVDIRTVLKTVGEITGINFIPHQSVTGTVTVMSPTPIRLGDLYAFLQSILDVYGYAAVETDNAVKIVPKADAARNYTNVRIGADPADIPRTDTIITQIIPLKYADAGEVSQIIEPVLSAGAQMATYPRTNSVMITDTSANVHHVAQIISRLDVAGAREKVLLLPLAHASARVVSEQITAILEKTRAGATPQAGRTRTAQGSNPGPNVLPDDRTNSLIIIAGEQDTEMITRLARQIDIERPTNTNNVHVVYLKNGDANEVAPSLESALTSMRLTGAVDAAQQIQVTADASTNSLIIVAPPQDFEVISGIIDKLDIVREQVFVEMQIIEVTEEALQEIGVDWATLDQAVTDSVRGFGLTNLGPRAAFLGGTAEGLIVGAWKGSGDNNIAAILQALRKESAVNILSTPQILTSNHRKATIVVGENRPFITESRITQDNVNPAAPTVIQGFEYKDVGITLEVTPHVSQGGMIRMEIDSEFTKLIDDVAASSLTTPITAKRTAQTVVAMQSGATVVIGGLIRDDKTRVTKKVPLLGDAPLIGPLFRSQADRTQKTDLLIFITPHVMASQEQLQAMTESKRGEMPPTFEEMQ
jgi:general secretion pathway protein D